MGHTPNLGQHAQNFVKHALHGMWTPLVAIHPKHLVNRPKWNDHPLGSIWSYQAFTRNPKAQIVHGMRQVGSKPTSRLSQIPQEAKIWLRCLTKAKIQGIRVSWLTCSTNTLINRNMWYGLDSRLAFLTENWRYVSSR